MLFRSSIMDYIFRWLQLRFLTGQQQALFDGLRPKYVNAPPPGVPDENSYGQKTFGDLMPSDGVPVSGLSSPELSSRAPSDLSSRALSDLSSRAEGEGSAVRRGSEADPSSA